jgi:hypothetical protein
MSAKGKKPTVKVQAVGLAGAATLILVFIAGLAGVDVPPEVAAALTLLFGWGAGYIKDEGA